MEKINQQIFSPIQVESSELTETTEMYNFCRVFEGNNLSDFNLIRFIVYPGQESVQDQHASKEYWYIAKGEGWLTINQREVHAKEGELYLFDTFTTHHIKNISEQDNIEILSIWW